MSITVPNPQPAHNLQGQGGHERNGSGGDLAPGLGGGQSRNSGKQEPKGLDESADRFAALLQGRKGATAVSAVAPHGAVAPVIIPAHPRKAQNDHSATDTACLSGSAQPFQTAPMTESAQAPSQFLPAGTAAAQAVEDIMQRVMMELRAASGRGGGLFKGGKISLALDLGRTALGVTSLRLDVTAQTLTIVLTVPAGGAAHDLPRAVQALAQGLAARHPHRTIRIDTDTGTPMQARSEESFNPLQPWAGRP